MSTLNITHPTITLELGNGTTTLNVSSGGLVPITNDVALVAGTNLSALRCITTNGSGDAIYATPDTVANAQVIGITATAAAAGDTVAIRTGGLLTDASWSWTKGAVYLGTNGTLTQTAPSGGGIIVHVARALTSTTIIIDIDTLITTV